MSVIRVYDGTTQQKHTIMKRRDFLRTTALGAALAVAPISFSAFGSATKKTATRLGRLNLSFEPYELRLRHAFNLARYQRTTTPDVQVKLEYDGLVGYGEASMPPYLGESVESVCSFLNRLDLGQFADPFLIEDIHDYMDSVAPNNRAAKASVDIALHDLLGKIMGQPWYKIWGLNPDKCPNTSFTISYDADPKDYMAKYLFLAIAGAIGGFICSIPFSNMMLESVSRNMVLGGGNSYYALEFAGAFIVVAAILLFAFRCTKLVKKLSPIDAIRSGQTGERYNRKSPLRLGKSRGSTSRFLAINDVLSAPRRYATIIITFFICTVLVLLLVNTTSTMRSDTLVTTLASNSDLYYTDLTEMMGSMTADGRERVENYLRDTEKLLAENDMPARVISEVQYKYGVSTGGKDYSIVCLQGIHTKASDYEYTEGLVPQNANEIAITPTIAKMTGAKIGDTVTIDYGTEKRKCIVVAYFQSMNQLGAVIRLHEDAPTDFAHISNMAAYQINFTDDPAASEIENRKEKIKKLFDNEDVMNAAEYCDDSMNCASAMEAVQYLFLGITLIVVVLICVLMERSFISDEKSQIAILKATGFSDQRIIRWHTARFGFVTLIAVLLAAICSVPVTHLVDGPIYSMLGVSKLSYVIDPWKIFLIYPGIVFLMTLAASGLTALHIRGIKSSDISNIE